MGRLVPIGEAAKLLGISKSTLRRWDADGTLVAQRTTSGHRCYDLATLLVSLSLTVAKPNRQTVAQAATSGDNHPRDLDWHLQMIEAYLKGRP